MNAALLDLSPGTVTESDASNPITDTFTVILGYD